MSNVKVFYGVCALLLSVVLLFVSIDRLWGSVMIILSQILIVASIILLIKGLIENRKNARAEQKALENSAIHQFGDDELNKKLKSLKNKVNLCWILLAVLIVLIFVQMSMEIATLPTMLLNILACPAVLILQGSIRKKMKNFVSGNILQKILEEHFSNVEHKPASSLAEHLIKDSNMGLPYYQQYSGGDYVKANYRGLDFSMSDIHLQKKVTKRNEEDKDETYYETVFRGQMILCKTGKELPAEVRLYPSYRGDGSSLQSSNLDFNKVFHVESDAPDKAFDVLTPVMVKKILDLSGKLACPLHIRFDRDGQVRVALHNDKDNFEVGRGKKMDAAIMRRRFTEEVERITSVLDILL